MRTVSTVSKMARDAWIHTYTGKKFRPLDPDPKLIDLQDVAHALSNVCRYTGHAAEFYSVAEHSVRVLWFVEDHSGVIAGKDPADRSRLMSEAVRWALLHDASEAYLSDLAAPVKSVPEMEHYRRAEKALEHSIAVRFKLPRAMPEIVRFADRSLLASEWPVVFNGAPAPWGSPFPPPSPRHVEGLGWSPKHARSMFLEASKRIGIV